MPVIFFLSYTVVISGALDIVIFKIVDSRYLDDQGFGDLQLFESL